MAKLTRKELLYNKKIWLLDIFYAGQTFHFSNETIIIQKKNGDSIIYKSSFKTLSFEESFNLFEINDTILSYQFALVFPVDISKIINDGFPFDLAKGDLSLFLKGRVYEDRYILISQGNIIEPLVGSLNEPIEFSLEQNLFSSTDFFPNANNVLNALSWPLADSEGVDPIGIAYPMVFGNPGVSITSTGVDLELPATPAYIINTTNIGAGNVNVPLVIAGHETSGGTVTITDNTTSATDVRTVYTLMDGLNNIVSVVYLDGDPAGSLPAILGDEYYVCWTDAYGLKDEKGNSIKGLGSLLIKLLKDSDTKIDIDIFKSYEETLNKYIVSGFIDEFINVWEWISDNVIPIIPISFFSSINGIYPYLYDFDNKNIAAELNANIFDCRKESKLNYINTKIINEQSFRFALKFSETDPIKKYRRYITNTTELTSSYRYKRRNLYLYTSGCLFGKKNESELKSDIVYDNATASIIMDWRSRFYAFNHKSIKYNIYKNTKLLDLGDIVYLTDDTMNFNKKQAIVKSIEWLDGSVITELLIFDDYEKFKLVN